MSYKTEIYRLVSDARESCCGSDVQDRKEVLRRLGKALSRARFLNVPKTIILKIDEACCIVEKSQNYYERLPADNILCLLLNTELKCDD